MNHEHASERDSSSSPDLAGLSREARLAQVDRLASSSHFQAAESLIKILRYLAQQSLDCSAPHIKEYEIATEALGRSANFDPQAESSVRVQIGRLRNKLNEYYASEGAQDPVLIQLPKGNYTLLFERRVVPQTSVDSPETAAPIAPLPNAPARRLRPKSAILLAASLLLLIVSAWLYVHGRTTSISPVPVKDASDYALSTFWGPFLRDADNPFVIYSNASFVGSPKYGMHYYDPARDTKGDVVQHYTGIGEVVGAVRITQVFDRFGRNLRLKRSGLFTLDDAMNSNLVFLGSATENPQLSKVTSTSEFIMGYIPHDKSGAWGFIPTHPRPGDPAGYSGTPPATPWSIDYGLIALVPGPNPRWHVLILEGISTLSTQAAAEFVCDETSVESLLKKLGVKPGSAMPTFEALIRVKVAGDVPIKMELLDVRKTSN